MKVNIPSNLVHVIILDISGIYAQIHNQGYFDKITVDDIKKQYFDESRWRIIIIEWVINCNTYDYILTIGITIGTATTSTTLDTNDNNNFGKVYKSS